MTAAHALRGAIVAAMLMQTLPTVAAQQSPGAAETPTSATGLYTTDQAEHGRVLFQRHCGLCHTAVAGGAPVPLPPGQGFWLGASRLKINLGGRYVQKYPTMYHLGTQIDF